MSDLPNWSACAAPDLPSTMGRFVQIEPFDGERDGPALFTAIGGPGNDDLWRYIPFGPLDDADGLAGVLAFMAGAQGWKTHIIKDAKSGAALGMASYMRIRPEAGSAEIGSIVFSKALQKTPAATEAMYIMARHLFDDQNYRRYEWKCHDGNEASKRAALRLGFVEEGVFRNDMVVKGENRDTAWFSIIDREWPQVKSAFEAWLAPENFDEDGKQRQSLAELRTRG